MATQFENINVGAFVDDLSADGFRSGGVKINANFDKVQVKTKPVYFTVTNADDKAALVGKINALALVTVGPDERPLFVGSTVPGAADPRHVVIELLNKGKGVYGAGSGVVLGVNDIEIISDRVNESPVINQDNIAIRKTYILPDAYTQAQVAAVVNAGPLFNVTDVQSLWVQSLVLATSGPLLIDAAQTKLWKLINKGKGAYGAGGTVVLSAADLMPVEGTGITAADIEGDPSTQTINYGAIVSPATVSTWLNTHTPPIVIQSQTGPDGGIRFFKGTIDGIVENYIFKSAAGTYGVGQLQTTLADFELFEEGQTSGTAATLDEVAINGNSTAQELISTNGTEAAALEPDGAFSLKNSGKKLRIQATEITADKYFNIDGSKANGDTFAMLTDVNGLTLTANQAVQEVYLKNAAGTTLATLNVAFLNNEGTTFFYNSATGNLELKNDAGVVLSVIPVSAFVTNLVHNAAFNGTTPSNLEFKDTSGTVLFTVPVAINNVLGLQAALDAKLTGTIASDAETQISAAVTEDNKVVSRSKLFNWWAWIKTQAATITANWNFTVSPTVPTAAVGDTTTKAASTEFVKTAVDALEAKDNPVYVGDIYNKTTWANLSDFVASPTATVTITGSKLAFSGGTNDYTKTLEHNFYTMRDKFTYMVKFIAQEKTTTSYGFAVNFGRAPVRMVFDMTSGVNSGKVSLLNPTTGVTSSAALAWAVNDEITMRLERNGAKVKIILRNETTPAALVSLDFTFPVSFVSLQNTNRISIASLGGNFTITQLRYNSSEFKNPVVTIVGDSKTQLYSATDNANVWSKRYIQNCGSGNIHAGQGDQTIHVLNSLPEIIGDSPKSVVLNIGRNDISQGVTYAAYTANYASIVSQLTTAGIKVWHFLPIYEPSLNQVPLRDFITATYASADIVDTYTPSVGLGLTVDGTHPNDLLQNIIFNTAVSANKIKPGKYYPPNTESVVAEMQASISDAAKKSVDNTFLGLTYLQAATQTKDISPLTANAYNNGYLANPWLRTVATEGCFAKIKPLSTLVEFTDFSNNSQLKVFSQTTGNVTVNSSAAQTEKFYVNGSGRYTGALTVNGLINLGQYTDGTEPAYVKGAGYFNTTINKMKLGGATAWEIVTSS